MPVEELIAGRFRVLERVGQGGMGQVFRAEDLDSGRIVAVKRMTSLDPALGERFLLEAKTLASLSHPTIVGYVAHGMTGDHEPYLAMDWIEGEDLSRTLEHGGLGLRDAWTIVRRIAEALATAHAGGIIHRDLKPANVMLVGGRPEGAILVDFGIARREAFQHNITRTGAIIGTVGYMAPEQLQGARDIDARADLFSLGCVAFELFCGRPAFEGGNLGAVVGRLLFGEPPRLRDVAPSLPEPVEALVLRLLQSDRELRFASAGEVLVALDELEPLTHLIGAPTEHASRTRPAASLHTERTPVAMVLALPSPASQTSAPETVGATATELPISEQLVDLNPVRRAFELAAKHWGARVSTLAGGLVLSFTQTSAVQERVHRAARAALDIHHALPGWRVSLLLSHEQRSQAGSRVDDPHTAAMDPSAEVPAGVVIDPSAGAFLGDEFERDGLILTAFVPSRDEARKVLGRSAPCLGRDKELRLIEGTLDECIDEETCRALILRASAGIGKSRIRREFVARVRDQGQVETLVCRCDVGSPSISFGVIRAWIGEALEFREHPAATRYAVLRERVLPRLRPSGGESAEQVLEFFAELANVSVPEPSPLLLDARANAREMRRMLQLALETWLRAETQSTPLVLVLEDLHWADPASMSLLTSLWPSLDELPLLLLITTWPEAEDVHPAVFGLKGAQILDVAPLGKRASERLARQLLGDTLPPEQLSRLVEFAGGNAFLLEELLRHVGAGHSLASFPGSAVAMVQARLTELAPEARRLLRAASVLGERFDLAAVEAMCGADVSQVGVEGLLERLTRAELVIPPSADEQGQSGSWAFRHSLVRQAAYELLTDADRVVAHLAAARWLTHQSSVDPAAVAGHFEQAEAWNEAAPWFLAAVREREELGDFEAIIALAARIDRPEIDRNIHAEMVYSAAMARLYSRGDMGMYEELGKRLEAGEFELGSSGWGAILISVLAVKVHMGIGLEQSPEFAQLEPALAALEPSDATIAALCILTVSLWHAGSLSGAENAATLLRSMTSAPDTPPGRIALRDAYVPWTEAGHDPNALAEHRRGTELARRHCGLMRQLEILAPYAVFLCEFGHDQAAAELLDDVRALTPDNFFDIGGWTLLGQVYLNLAGPAPQDRRDLIEGAGDHDWLHLTPLILANLHASPSLADPSRPELAREAIVAVEPLLDACGPLISSLANVRTVLAELSLTAGEPERALAEAELALGPPMLLMPRTHARAVISRLRALAALGRGPEANTVAEHERERLRGYIAGLGDGDRETFASMAPVAAILEFHA